MSMRSSPHHARVIWLALFSDGAIAAVKFIAAAHSGSAVMLSEALHSLADTSTQVLLLAGKAFSLRPATPKHPFGHGKERFFWPLIVSFLIFSIGGVFSVMRGVEQIRHPHPLLHLERNLLVFLIALILDSVSWLTAFRAITRSSRTSFWHTIRESKTPGVLAVFLEDTAGIAGVGIAALGTLAVSRTGI